ncbi:hypothetical protein SRHO_G00173490 [Serrasalmus rhombeus]
MHVGYHAPESQQEADWLSGPAVLGILQLLSGRPQGLQSQAHSRWTQARINLAVQEAASDGRERGKVEPQ